MPCFGLGPPSPNPLPPAGEGFWVTDAAAWGWYGQPWLTLDHDGVLGSALSGLLGSSLATQMFCRPLTSPGGMNLLTHRRAIDWTELQ